VRLRTRLRPHAAALARGLLRPPSRGARAGLRRPFRAHLALLPGLLRSGLPGGEHGRRPVHPGARVRTLAGAVARRPAQHAVLARAMLLAAAGVLVAPATVSASGAATGERPAAVAAHIPGA